MRKIRFWKVDAFTNIPFKGNPAAVLVIVQPLEDQQMQNIAIKINLSETAFILLRQNKNPLLRWFTPMDEIDLCGHATLAAAKIYFDEINPEADNVTFETKFVGELSINKFSDKLTMKFPSRPGVEKSIQDIPNFVLSSLSDKLPTYAMQARDLMLVYDEPETVLNMQPNFTKLLPFDKFIIVTSKSNNPKYDFIPRFFSCSVEIPEDPVTSSAHCTLAPYWSAKLNENKMLAYQTSKRSGVLNLELQ